jgi:RND family efflux transporter MFP subunit
MTEGSTAVEVLRQCQGLFHSGIAGSLSDGELIEAFLDSREDFRDAAFLALVNRHGPMVLRVCNRTLHDPHDAEDAFQATFLVLVRRAGSIRKRPSVASWLFGVACRASAGLRLKEARRRRSERRRAALAESFRACRPAVEGALDLHAEVGRLPEKYREPLVLCYFEGLTHEQAAGRLRWPVGTVKVRLSRAREQLRRRLGRLGWDAHSLTLAGPAGADALATTSESLVSEATRLASTMLSGSRPGAAISSRAANLAHGVLKAMLIQKLKWSTLLLAGVLCAGLGGAVAARQPGGPQESGRPDPSRADDGKQQRPAALSLVGTTAFDSDATLRVRPPFECRVEKVLVDVGTTVRKGDPVIELYSTDLAAARANYEVAVARWRRDKEVRDQRASQVQKGLVSTTSLLDSENEELKSRLEMKVARDKLLVLGLSEGEVEQARDQDTQQKARMVLRSRADGMVIRRDAVAGNFYDTKDVLLEIAPVDHLWVSANVPEQSVPNIKVGQDVTLRFPFDDRPVRARVDFIEPFVDRATGTVKIRATIPNRDRRLRAGMFTHVELEADDEPRPVRQQVSEERPPARPSAADTRLDALERKVDRLLEERATSAKILDRLDALERKLDRLLDARRGK